MLYSSFYLAFGAFMALSSLVTLWLWRRSPDPVFFKIFGGSVLAALACYVPFTISSLLGQAVPIKPAELPDELRLIGVFSTSDDSAYLWTIEADVPRSYVLSPLPPSMKPSLRDAMREIQRSGQAVLRRKSKQQSEPGQGTASGHSQDEKKQQGKNNARGVVTTQDDDQNAFVLDDAATQPTK